MTQTQAILCAFGAFLSWVLVDTAIKLAGQAALLPFTITGIMGIVAVTGLIGSAYVKKDFSVLRPLHPRQQMAIALCSVTVNYANVIALKHLPLTIFYIVVFTTPLVIAVFVALLKHETLTKTKITCLFAGFFGVLVAVGLRGGGDWIGYVAGAASVMGFATYTVIMRTIATTDTAESMQLLVALTLSVSGILGSLQMTALPNGSAIMMMVIAGAINLGGNLLYNKALNHTTSTNVAQIHYTQIISGGIIAYLIWHEVPTWNLVLGAVIIIASGVIVAAQARKSESGQN